MKFFLQINFSYIKQNCIVTSKSAYCESGVEKPDTGKTVTAQSKAKHSITN